MWLERALRVGYGAAANALEMLQSEQVREESWNLLTANPNALVDLLDYKGRQVEAEARQFLERATAQAPSEPDQEQLLLPPFKPPAAATPDAKIDDLVAELRRLRQEDP